MTFMTGNVSPILWMAKYGLKGCWVLGIRIFSVRYERFTESEFMAMKMQRYSETGKSIMTIGKRR